MPKKNQKTYKGIMVFVLDEEKNILLLKRINNNQWEPIKGLMNDKEKWLSASRRELKEKININPSKDLKISLLEQGEVLEKNNNETIKIKGYAVYCFITGKKPSIDLKKNYEHSDFRWVSCEEIENEIIYPSVANKLVTKIKKELC